MLDGSRVTSRSFGPGRAGDTSINAGTLRLTGGAQVDSAAFASGAGGDLSIAASEDIVIDGRFSSDFRSGLFSIADGSGDGGNVNISANGSLGHLEWMMDEF